jgi:hypothetical protein
MEHSKKRSILAKKELLQTPLKKPKKRPYGYRPDYSTALAPKWTTAFHVSLRSNKVH